MRIAVVSVKGGTGKTTTAVYLAVGLARVGTTVLVDTDPQGSASAWGRLATLPCRVVSAPPRALRRLLPGLVNGYAHAVVDTPPGDVEAVREVLASPEIDAALVVLSPSLLDMDRLRPTLELVAQAQGHRTLSWWVLLARVRRGTRSACAAQELLQGFGAPVLPCIVPLREEYARAFGAPIRHLRDYGPVLEAMGCAAASR